MSNFLIQRKFFFNSFQSHKIAIFTIFYIVYIYFNLNLNAYKISLTSIKAISFPCSDLVNTFNFSNMSAK